MEKLRTDSQWWVKSGLSSKKPAVVKPKVSKPNTPKQPRPAKQPTPKKPKWSERSAEEKLHYIKQHYLREGPKRLSAILGLDAEFIRQAALELGIVDRIQRQHDWSKEEEQQLKELYETKTASQCAQILGRSRNSVKHRLYLMGLRKQASFGEAPTEYYLFTATPAALKLERSFDDLLRIIQELRKRIPKEQRHGRTVD